MTSSDVRIDCIVPLKKELAGLKYIRARARNRDDHRAFARRLPLTRYDTRGKFSANVLREDSRGGLPTAVPINNNPRFDATERVLAAAILHLLSRKRGNYGY